MAPLPIIPFILTVMAAMPSSKPAYTEIYPLPGQSNPRDAATFTCLAKPLFAELQHGPVSNKVKVYALDFQTVPPRKMYWTVHAESNGTVSLRITQNTADASVFAFKTEKGEFHEGGRFNIEFSQSQTAETLLFEAASPSGNVQHQCFPHHLIGKPQSLSRAIDRFTDTESSGMEEQNPGTWYNSYPVMGIVTPSYCSMNPKSIHCA